MTPLPLGNNQYHPSFFFIIWYFPTAVVGEGLLFLLLVWWKVVVGLPNLTWNSMSLLLLWLNKTWYLAETEEEEVAFVGKLTSLFFIFLLKTRPLMRRAGNFMSSFPSPEEKSKSCNKLRSSWWITLMCWTVWWSQTKWTLLCLTTNDPLLSSTSVSAIAAERKAFPGIVDQTAFSGFDTWKIVK